MVKVKIMVGRKEEKSELEERYNSKRNELIVVYGRWRAGKTYLVNETFSDRFTFQHTALSPLEMEMASGKRKMAMQLGWFFRSLKEHGLSQEEKAPADWTEAFGLLKKLLIQKGKSKRQVVFLDEFPWLDTKKSFFLTAFSGFWNGWACHQKNLMMILCGSAGSYLLNHFINGHGGLYDRVTYPMKLSPLSLGGRRNTSRKKE